MNCGRSPSWPLPRLVLSLLVRSNWETLRKVPSSISHEIAHLKDVLEREEIHRSRMQEIDSQHLEKALLVGVVQGSHCTPLWNPRHSTSIFLSRRTALWNPCSHGVRPGQRCALHSSHTQDADRTAGIKSGRNPTESHQSFQCTLRAEGLGA